MNLDTYAMVDRIERDLRVASRERTREIQEARHAHRSTPHPVVVHIGRAFSRLGERLQGLPASPRLDLRVGRESA